MQPVISPEMLGSAVELVVYFVTLLTAVWSCLWVTRA
jgi:hypothetical protein